jgi:menaquinone-dependent protoporphyrinogen IX oxidase
MKSLVVYSSRGGKTGKIAKTIASELGCTAVNVDKEKPDVSDVELLVVGSGTYGGRPSDALQAFLENLSVNKRKAAIFVSSGGPEPKSLTVMKETLEKKRYSVVSSFKSRGQFIILNWGRPNADDLNNARAFAAELSKLI